jgi:hypothetical protein
MTLSQCNNAPWLTVADPNGPQDILECGAVDAPGEPTPTLAVFVTNVDGRGNENVTGVNLTLATARELRDFLNAFLWRHDID